MLRGIASTFRVEDTLAASYEASKLRVPKRWNTMFRSCVATMVTKQLSFHWLRARSKAYPPQKTTYAERKQPKKSERQTNRCNYKGTRETRTPS